LTFGGAETKKMWGARCRWS